MTKLQTTEDRQTEPKPRLAWMSHPARKEPVKAALALMVIAGMAVAASSLAGLFMGILAFVVLVASVSGFLFPTRYELMEDRLVIRPLLGKQERPWSALRRASVGAAGVHLSPFSARNRMDATRGLYLRFEDNRDEVMDAISSLLPAGHADRAAPTPRTPSSERLEAGARPIEGGCR